MKAGHFLISTAIAIIAATSASAEKLVIMHTNDVHGNLAPAKEDDRGGIVRRKVLIDSIRNAEKNTVLIDAGDDVQGFLYFTLYGGKVEYEAMNRLGYEFVVPGNHEFDNGMDSLARNYRILKAEKLCANYDVAGTPLQGLIKEYAIKKFGGKKFAFIGVGCQPKGMIAPENIVGVKYKDAVTVADSIAGLLKSNGAADYAVVVSHIGYSSDRPELPSDSLLAIRSRNVDMIIGGHSHTLIDPKAKNHPKYLLKNRDGKYVLIAQTGRGGEYLGKITVDLDDLEKTPSYELLPVDSRYDKRGETDLENWLAGYTAGVDSLKNIVIGKSAATYPGGEMNPLSNWVADMVYEIGRNLTDRKVDLAVVNKGGIRQSLPKGDVSLGLILSMLPFSNKIDVIELDGESLLQGLDVMASRGGDAVSSHVSAGMKNGKAVDVRIGGKPIDPKRSYLIATIDYLAEGGDNMASFTKCKTIVRSKHDLKNDAIEYIKRMTKDGKIITPDTAERMYPVK